MTHPAFVSFCDRAARIQSAEDMAGLAELEGPARSELASRYSNDFSSSLINVVMVTVRGVLRGKPIGAFGSHDPGTPEFAADFERWVSRSWEARA